MSGGLVFLLFGAFFALVIVLMVVGVIQAKKRREAFGLLASQRGWTYAERDDRWTDVFDGSPFGLGHNRKAGNVLSGQYDGRPFIAFDYVYYTTETSTDSEGRTSRREVSHNFGIVGLDMVNELGNRPFPTLCVTPEGLFGRMIGRLTDRDIELESEDFNRAFTVHCEDRKFASDILHPRLMETLLAHYRDLDWRFDHSWIVTIGTGSNDLVDTQRAMDALATIIATVPDFVWQDRGAANPPANA